MKLAFLYAGQGTQHVGMGKDLYEAYPAFRAVLDGARVDFDLKKLCFEGPEEQIHRLFFELRERLGQTIVVVTHDEHLAAMADRTITMSDGRILLP